MSESTAFDLTCEILQERTSLDRLEARGTVRLALKQAGLEARMVTPTQMAVVAARVLPAELEARGVEDATALCRSLEQDLGRIEVDEEVESPDAVFARLGS